MKSFKQHLKEDISTEGFSKANMLILKYMNRKTGLKFFHMVGAESYVDKFGKGVGIRFLTAKGHCIRFNWKKTPSAARITSVDYWPPNSKGQTMTHVAFDRESSIIKILPMIADIVNDGPKALGRVAYTKADGVPLEESVEYDGMLDLTEQAHQDMFEHIIDMMQQPNFSKGTVYNVYKGTGAKIFDALVQASPMLAKKGSKYTWEGSMSDARKLLMQADKILASVGCVKATITTGAAQQTIGQDAVLDKLEADRERLTYQKQLADLTNLVKLTIAGSSNALFVAGRGGIGKTHTVEEVMHSLGLRDGDGYFKNTGSASAAGIYELLFKHRDSIVFFDDSDDALKDQEARNIFKAATDTKKSRKLVWNKKSSNIVDPENYSDYDEIEDGLVPRYFEFTGKVIFISNLKMDKLDPDGALRTRAFMIEIDPTDAEIYDFMEAIVDKIPIGDGLTLDTATRISVVDLLRTGKSKQTANLRKLSRALNMKAGAVNSGVNITDKELTRMIEYYA